MMNKWAEIIIGSLANAKNSRMWSIKTRVGRTKKHRVKQAKTYGKNKR